MMIVDYICVSVVHASVIILPIVILDATVLFVFIYIVDLFHKDVVVAADSREQAAQFVMMQDDALGQVLSVIYLSSID